MTENRWRKSTHSQPNGDCVEVHQLLDQVRDSKDPAGPPLHGNIAALVQAVKAGRFDR